jgi:hypothetical protein
LLAPISVTCDGSRLLRWQAASTCRRTSAKHLSALYTGYPQL